MNGGLHLADDFERRVRERLEPISNSKEIKNVAADFKNMAEDMRREFGTYCNKNPFADEKRNSYRPQQGGNPQYSYQKSSQEYHVGRQKGFSGNHYGTSFRENSNSNLPMEKKYKTFSVSGTLLTVFGGIGLGIFSFFLFIILWMMTALELVAAPFAFLAMLLLIFISSGMLGRGVYLLKQTSRLKKYLKIIGKGQFCPIDLLARESGWDKNFVLKDLSKMIKKKILPDAHIDDEKTCLMLTEDVYHQYLYVQQKAKQRQQEEERLKKEREEERQQEEAAWADNPELAATIRQGREMIEKIRKANDRIPGEEISEKMFRLEKIAEQIFEQVQMHPEKLPDIRRLMNYYLPTTLKLLSNYEEFDKQPIQGENIKTAKKQIEQSLDTINSAFENLLDQLFTDEVLDISSDISVLETMLKQEGLTGSEFKSKE